MKKISFARMAARLGCVALTSLAMPSLVAADQPAIKDTKPSSAPPPPPAATPPADGQRQVAEFTTKILDTWRHATNWMRTHAAGSSKGENSPGKTQP